jgi:deoxycytidylate deaminase
MRLVEPRDLQWCPLQENTAGNAEIVCDACVLAINVWNNSPITSEVGAACVQDSQIIGYGYNYGGIYGNS